MLEATERGADELAMAARDPEWRSKLRVAG